MAKYEYLVRRIALKLDLRKSIDFILANDIQTAEFLSRDEWSGDSYQEYLSHLGSKGWQLIRIHDEKREDHEFGYKVTVILTFIRRKEGV